MKGVTLLELMIGLAIAGILVSVAIPAMSNFIKANRNIAAQDNLIAGLSYARSEAIARGEPVALCASSDDSTCGGSWNDGWIVFQDDDTSGTRQTSSPAEELIRVQQDDANTNISEAASSMVVRFNSTGLPNGSMSFSICDPDGDVDPTGVTLTPVGRANKVDSASVSCP